MRFLRKERKIRNAYISAFGLLTISYLLVFFVTREMKKKSDLVNHNTEVINNLEVMLSYIKDSDVGFRGYVIMKDTTFLETYYNSILFTNSTIIILQNLVARDDEQKQNLDSISSKVMTKWSINGKMIEDIKRYRTIDQDRLNNGIYKLKLIMDDIRRSVLRMQMHENHLLELRINEFEFVSSTLKIAHLTAFVIALMIAVYSVRTYNSENKAKKLYRAKLEEGIEKLKIANENLINLKNIEKLAMTGRISQAIAHEVRNPLTNISLAAEQLTNIMNENEEASLLLTIISRNTSRIHNLVQELLNSTRPYELTLIKLSLNYIIEQALELTHDRIELHTIKVIKQYSHDPCLVEVDSEKMKIAFLNLFINAIEAMEPDKGVLEIRTTRKQDKCYAWIVDNGIGMNDESLSRIFEPYYTQKLNGSGVGLTLTQNIILNHKGNIVVESQQGKGTTVMITLNHCSS